MEVEAAPDLQLVTSKEGCGGWCLAAYGVVGAVHATLPRSLRWRVETLGHSILLDAALALLVPLQRYGYARGARAIATGALMAGFQCIYLPTAAGFTFGTFVW